MLEVVQVIPDSRNRDEHTLLSVRQVQQGWFPDLTHSTSLVGQRLQK